MVVPQWLVSILIVALPVGVLMCQYKQFYSEYQESWLYFCNSQKPLPKGKVLKSSCYLKRLFSIVIGFPSSEADVDHAALAILFPVYFCAQSFADEAQRYHSSVVLNDCRRVKGIILPSGTLAPMVNSIPG